MSIKLAVLDDYQGLALKSVDWTPVREKGVEVVVFNDTLHDQDALAERLKPFTIICTIRERTPLKPELLARLPNLKLITTQGARNASLPYSSPELLVLSAKKPPPGSGTVSPTLEHIWALILAAAKNIVDSTERVQHKKAGQVGGVPWHGTISMGISGKTLGILGFGKLGQALLPVARALEMKLLVWSPNLTRERVTPLGSDIEMASSLQDLMSRSDIVTVQMVLSPRSRHIIGAKELSYMKADALFVNTSRGGLVDTPALVNVLKRGAIRGAALDVFEEEPLISGNPFEGLTNVTLTPHMAFSEEVQFKSWYEQTVENVLSFLEDGGVKARADGQELVDLTKAA